MVNYIYKFEANPIRYLGEIGKERFIKMVAKDSKLPEEKIRTEMKRTTEIPDIDLTYNHFHRVVKHDANGRRVLL